MFDIPSDLICSLKSGLGICKDTGQPRHIAATARLGTDLYAAGLVHRPEERDEQDARGYLLARACGAYVAFASFAGPTGEEFSETLGRRPTGPRRASC